MAGWTAFAKHCNIFKTLEHAWRDKSTTLAYFQQWQTPRKHGHSPITSQAKNKLAATQTKMERSMLNIIYRDRRTNIWVRENTKVTDVTEQVRRRKWTWAGHVSRIRDNRWKPYQGKRAKGRLVRRWRHTPDNWLPDYLYVETRPPVIWTGKNEYGRVEIWVDG